MPRFIHAAAKSGLQSKQLELFTDRTECVFSYLPYGSCSLEKLFSLEEVGAILVNVCEVVHCVVVLRVQSASSEKRSSTISLKTMYVRVLDRSSVLVDCHTDVSQVCVHLRNVVMHLQTK